MISKIVDYYDQPEFTSLYYKCPKCETNDSIFILENVKNITVFCKVCDCIIDIEVVVCPDCKSSASVTENVDECNLFNKEIFPYKCLKCATLF